MIKIYEYNHFKNMIILNLEIYVLPSPVYFFLFFFLIIDEHCKKIYEGIVFAL